jgi:hypothetical protein
LGLNIAPVSRPGEDDVIIAGWPVAMGFTIRTSFWEARSRVPIPKGFIEGRVPTSARYAR